MKNSALLIIVCALFYAPTSVEAAENCTAQFKQGSPSWILGGHKYGVNYEWIARGFKQPSGQLWYVGPRHMQAPESALTNFSEGCKSLKEYQGD